MTEERFRHYLLGIDILDKEHIELFKLFSKCVIIFYDKLNTNKDNEINNILITIKDKLILHFITEERIMDEINYPYRDYHKKEHKVLLSKYENFINKDTKIKNYSKHVINGLEEYLTNHVDYQDMQIKTYIEKNGIVLN